MARTMDQVEQIAVTLLDVADPVRHGLRAWVDRITADADYVGSLSEATFDGISLVELRAAEVKQTAELEATLPAWDQTEWRQGDARIERLAAAVIDHRKGGDSILGRSTRYPDADYPRLTGLSAEIARYVRSISESAGRLHMHIEDGV